MFIKKNKLSYTLLTLSVLFLFFIIFKSEFIFSGEKRSYYKTYYQISFVLILISFLSLFLSMKLKIYFNIILVTLFLGIYFFEILISIQNKKFHSKIIEIQKKQPIQKKINYEKLTGKKYDERTKYEVFLAEKKQNSKTVVAVHPHYYLEHKELNSSNLLPLSGISNAPTILCNENGYYSSYLSDRYGFNNPDTEWNSKEIEFFIVGGSFTNGSCVNRPNDMASVLRTLSNKNVVSVGMGGSGPLLQFASLKEYFNKSIKNVIWIYYEYNLLDLKKELDFNSKILNNYLNDNFSQNLINKQNKIDVMGYDLIDFAIKKEDEAIIRRKAQNEEMLNLKNENFLSTIIDILKLKNIRNVLSTQSSNEIKYPEEKLKIILKKAKEFTKSNESNFYLVFLPTHQRYLTNLNTIMYNFNFDFYAKVKNISEELDINFIDLHEDFLSKQTNYKDLLPLGIDGHFNVNGYKKVSEFIFKFIQQNN